MTAEKLLDTSNKELLDFFKRAIELKEGKGPFDIDQLEKEILKRMEKPA